MPVPDAAHPIWALLKQAMVFASVGLALWVNNKTFDGNEISTLIMVLLAQSGIELPGVLLRKPPTHG